MNNSGSIIEINQTCYFKYAWPETWCVFGRKRFTWRPYLIRLCRAGAARARAALVQRSGPVVSHATAVVTARGGGVVTSLTINSVANVLFNFLALRSGLCNFNGPIQRVPIFKNDRWSIFLRPAYSWMSVSRSIWTDLNGGICCFNQF